MESSNLDLVLNSTTRGPLSFNSQIVMEHNKASVAITTTGAGESVCFKTHPVLASFLKASGSTGPPGKARDIEGSACAGKETHIDGIDGCLPNQASVSGSAANLTRTKTRANLTVAPPVTGTKNSPNLTVTPPVTHTKNSANLTVAPPVTRTKTSANLTVAPPVTRTKTSANLTVAPPVTGTKTIVSLTVVPPVTGTKISANLPATPSYGSIPHRLIQGPKSPLEVLNFKEFDEHPVPSLTTTQHHPLMSDSKLSELSAAESDSFPPPTARKLRKRNGIRTISPRTISPRTISPGQYPPRQYPPRTKSPRTISPLSNIPPDNIPPDFFFFNSSVLNYPKLCAGKKNSIKKKLQCFKLF